MQRVQFKSYYFSKAWVGHDSTHFWQFPHSFSRILFCPSYSKEENTSAKKNQEPYFGWINKLFFPIKPRPAWNA